MRCVRAVVCLAAGWRLAAAEDWAPPRFTLELDEEPEHRWDHIVAARKDTFVKAIETIFATPQLKSFFPIAKRIIGNGLVSGRLFPPEQLLEMKGISRELGLEMSEIVLIGVFYDLVTAANAPFAFPACSGIVAQTASGEILHGRNLDYSFGDALRSAAIVVDFARKNQTLFTAVTFGPNPTFNTGVRYGSFSITHDERDSGNFLTNLFDVIILGRTALFSQIRIAMESDSTRTYKDAVDFFSTIKLSAPGYFIIGGTKAGEGAVVTRERDVLIDLWQLNATAGRWYILETNYDHFLPPGPGDDRRHPEMRVMDAIGQAHIDGEGIWSALSITQVNSSAGERQPLNPDTIYSTIMQASNPAAFKTMVRRSQAPLFVV